MSAVMKANKELDTTAAEKLVTSTTKGPSGVSPLEMLLTEAKFTLVDKKDGGASGSFAAYKQVVLVDPEVWEHFELYMQKHQEGKLPNPRVLECAKAINTEFAGEGSRKRDWRTIHGHLKKFG